MKDARQEISRDHFRLLLKNKNGEFLVCKYPNPDFPRHYEYDFPGTDFAVPADKSAIDFMRLRVDACIGESASYLIDPSPVSKVSLVIRKHEHDWNRDINVDITFFVAEYHGGQLPEKDTLGQVLEWREVSLNSTDGFRHEIRQGLYDYLKEYLSLYEKPKRLYWVSTKDGDENWFVISHNIRSARAFHEYYEGYDSGEAKAELIGTVNKQYDPDKSYHAQTWMLKDMGFEIMSNDRWSGRIIRKDGRIYREGIMENVTLLGVASEHDFGVYAVRQVNTSFFKIGVTKDVKARLGNMQTGNPHVFQLYAFYPNSRARILEKRLHELLSDRRVRGEWFELTHGDLERMNNYASDFVKD